MKCNVNCIYSKRILSKNVVYALQNNQEKVMKDNKCYKCFYKGLNILCHPLKRVVKSMIYCLRGA